MNQKKPESKGNTFKVIPNVLCLISPLPQKKEQCGESLAVMANESFLCIFRTCAAGRRSDYNDRVALNESDAAAL